MMLSIRQYKGLRQDISYTELPLEYCHELQNLDVDNPLGIMKVREGSSKLHTNVAFTNIISAYEYRFNKSGSTRLLVNDNGTLKVSSDAGATWSSLTLPSGATLESGFKNQYFGWKDHVIITTGNGSSNYVLWYGYIDRQTANNEGLFGDKEGFNGYKLLKSQLIPPNGTFSNVYNVVSVGEYNYFSFAKSRFIEKRDSLMRLVSRVRVNTNEATYEAIEEEETGLTYYTGPALCQDGTYIYAAYNTASGIVIEKIDPDGWVQVAESSVMSGIGAVGGIDTDGTHVYFASYGASGEVHKLLCSDLSNVTTVATANEAYIEDICCDQTATTGYLYTLKTGALERRSKSTLAYNAADDYVGGTSYIHCNYDNTNTRVLVTSILGDGHVYDFDPSGFVGGPRNDYTNVKEPKALIRLYVEVTYVWMAISSKYGTVERITSTTTEYPALVGIHSRQWITGDLSAGTYFYKFSLIDIDGQEFTLSDPVITTLRSDNLNIKLTVTAHTDSLDDLYRVAYINIYRAYSTDEDADVPGTDYKFLLQIDMNDTGWVDAKATDEIYYFTYVDNQTEDEISDVTFLENSGIGDAVKPRFINGKYLTYVDERLYIANYMHKSEFTKNVDYPFGILRSPVNQPDNITLYDPIGYEKGGGEAIKDITNAFGRVIAFKKRSFTEYYDGVQGRTFKYGLASEGAFDKRDEDLFFVSDKQIHHFDGNNVITIGDAVRDYFNDVNSLADVAVFFREDNERVYFSVKDNIVFVFNTKHRTWTTYTSGYAFSGFFRNYANQYIGWDDTSIYILGGSTKDKDNVLGTGGTAISCIYESSLVRFSTGEGEMVSLVGVRSRYDRNSGDTCNLKVYEFGNGKTLKETKALGRDGSGVTTVTDFLSALIGESYSFRLEITTPNDTTFDDAVFEWHGLSIEYVAGGYDV